MSTGIVDNNVPDDTHNLYDVTFFSDTIRTIVTNTPSYVDSWITEIESIHRRRRRRLIVGLDIEYRPSYSRIENPVATLQLCVGRRCLIFQLLYSPGIPTSLLDFLANPNYNFVGIGIGEDVEKITIDYALVVANAVELRELAADKYGRPELRKAGLKGLAQVVLEKEIEKPKSITMSEWDNEWLFPDQVQYACIDAFLSFEIGRRLMLQARSSLSTAQPAAMSTGIVGYILPDDTHNLYDVTFFSDTIRTIVTNTPSYVDSWIAEIESIHRPRLHPLIVGLKVEKRLRFDDIKNPVATLQLCVGRRCLIFQLLYPPGIPASLLNFLANPNYTFVGVGIDNRALVENTVDLRELAANKYGRSELREAGLKDLAQEVLGKEIERPRRITRSPWDNEWLVPGQVQYACIDAFLSCEIGRCLNTAGQVNYGKLTDMKLSCVIITILCLGVYYFLR